MLKYIVKRILSSVLVLLGVITITFFIARVLPSNPEVKWAGQRATPEQLAAARKKVEETGKKGFEKAIDKFFYRLREQAEPDDLAAFFADIRDMEH